MAQVIWKSTLQLINEQIIQVPKDAKILSVDNQSNSVCLWFLCDPKAPAENRWIEIYGTGHPIPAGSLRKFIGTVLIGRFVWHVFERLS